MKIRESPIGGHPAKAYSLVAGGNMKHLKKILQSEDGKMGYIIAWLIGIPIPILLLVFFLRGCH